MKYAIDCEMVGSGNKSLLARVSIVNEAGTTVLDEYVRPDGVVTDYRTFVSGISKNQLQNGQDFYNVQRKVLNIIKGCILIGHSLENDLSALKLTHPEQYLRDLAKYGPFVKANGGHVPSLKTLASNYLGKNIQSGEHNSVEDAKASMTLYQQYWKS